MRVLIIEDEQRAADRLKKMILAIDSSIEIISILDSIDSSVEWLKTNTHPELIFLDIHLSDGLSFNIFKQVEINCPIIFTTAFDQYALKAFEINSIDYLLKPINKDKLKFSLDKFHSIKNSFISSNNEIDLEKILSSISKKSKSYKSRFLVSKSDSLIIINVNEIAYFYSEDKVSFIMTKNKKRYILDDSLDTLISELDPKLFYRINRQIIVSIDSITKINSFFNYKLKLDLIPNIENLNTVISRAKVKEFKDWVKGS